MVAALKHANLVADKDGWAILREDGVLPINKMTEAPFPGVKLLPKACSKKKATYQ